MMIINNMSVRVAVRARTYFVRLGRLRNRKTERKKKVMVAGRDGRDGPAVLDPPDDVGTPRRACRHRISDWHMTGPISVI